MSARRGRAGVALIIAGRYLQLLGTAHAGDAQAWRLLGTAHAENDDDTKAIAAMGRALSAEPGDAAVLLALGVSHVNELHAGAAVSFLMRCALPKRTCWSFCHTLSKAR